MAAIDVGPWKNRLSDVAEQMAREQKPAPTQYVVESIMAQTAPRDHPNPMNWIRTHNKLNELLAFFYKSFYYREFAEWKNRLDMYALGMVRDGEERPDAQDAQYVLVRTQPYADAFRRLDYDGETELIDSYLSSFDKYRRSIRGGVRRRSQTAKFNRCVKTVKKSIVPRPKSSKESAAIAICTKSVLQTRGRTLKKYRKGRLLTQKLKK